MYKALSFGCFLAVLALPIVYGIDVKYTDCGSKIGKVSSVTVSGCDKGATRCILHRDTNVTVEISFVADADADKVKAVVHGVLLDVPVPFPISNPDGCVDSGLECPIKNGGTYVYSAKMDVLKKYPRVTVDVKWELKDGQDEDIACVLIPAKLV